MTKKNLKNKIIDSLNTQGFHLNGVLNPSLITKDHFKQIQSHARIEQLNIQKNFLKNNMEIAKQFSIDGKDIDPNKISLELRLVKEGSIEEVLYRWWNLMWWSVPYQKAYGRQMRFVLWDTGHDRPFGLIGLQSPVLKMAVRDNFLKIKKADLDSVINKSLQAQRLGALPPYNQLLGGKMVALSLVSSELREMYRKKYKGKTTIIKDRIIDPELLFITTTSAFGRSSIYNRLTYNDELVAKSLGYTKGAGTFHVSQEIYPEIQKFLEKHDINTQTTFGFGPSRKVKLLDKAFALLDLKEYHYHNIHREYFLFPLVKNLEKVIQRDVRPLYYKRGLEELVEYWKLRWALKRSESRGDWRDFRFDSFLKKTQSSLH